MKNTGSALIKRKESNNCKDFDDHIVDNNKHSKKRNSKSKQIHENYSLEPDLIELKKSQPRNSWTRFLKPSFSFHALSNVNNKPSVATQTTPDNSDDSPKSLKEFKELDIIGDKNINCFLNIENNARCKTKNQNESKYIESKSCLKKLNDLLPEEETSSTTTETSTTESDISEKVNIVIKNAYFMHVGNLNILLINDIFVCIKVILQPNWINTRSKVITKVLILTVTCNRHKDNKNFKHTLNNYYYKLLYLNTKIN